MPEPHSRTAVSDEGGLYGLDTTLDEAACVLIPVPFDATTSYRPGAAQGPEAILVASPQLDLLDLELGRIDRPGLAMLEIPEEVQAWSLAARIQAEPVIEAGEDGDPDELQPYRDAVNAAGDQVNEWLGAQVKRFRDQDQLVGVIGGDHSVPFASLADAAERWPGLGVLHVDAHADLRLAYQGFTWSHASILRNVRERCPGVSKVVGVAYRDLCEEEHEILERDGRFVPYYDPTLRRRLEEGQPWGQIAQEIVAHLPQQVYVTWDIDGLEPALCPHTGTPVPGGLSWAEATSLLRHLGESGREIVGFDLCEVAPDPDGQSEFDGNVGARLLYKLCGWALKTRA